MKHPNVKSIFSVLVLFTSLTLISSCDKDDDDDGPSNMVQFSATLNGQQETPPVNTEATGTSTATYNTTTNKLDYTINWSNLSAVPIGMHFHKAAVGVPGDVEIPITGFTPSVSGSYTGSATVDEEEEADLLDNKFYINIHTTNYAAGEIRGQLNKQ
jgi:hypothetical protein